MKTKALLVGCLALFAAVGIAAAADPAPELAAVHAVDDAWLKAFSGGDADAVAALYEEHAVLLPPGAPAAHGRAAIRSFFANMISGVTKDGLVFALGANPGGGVRGDLGWSSGSYTLKDKAGKVIDTGKYLSVSRKKDGKWLYVRDTWNSDGPPAKEAATPAKK